MTKEEALKIMHKTQKNYQKIALDFATSRKFLWPEFDIFKEYVKEGNKILDLGCGSGRLVELFSDYHVIDYIGIDNCQGLLDYARSKYPKENFINADVLNLPFPAKTFDAIFGIAVLNHFPKSLQMLALNNLRRALKPGGYLLMTNWNLWGLSIKKKSVWRYNIKRFFTSRKAWWQKYGVSKKKLGFKDVLTIWKKNNQRAVLYYYAFTLKELKQLVKNAGFIVVEAYHSKDGKKVSWYKGGNLVVVAKKL